MDSCVYKFVLLFIDLLKKGITACGTMLVNRRWMSAHFKDIRTLVNNARGSSRLSGMAISYMYSGEIIKLKTFCQQCTLRVRKFGLIVSDAPR